MINLCLKQTYSIMGMVGVSSYDNTGYYMIYSSLVRHSARNFSVEKSYVVSTKKAMDYFEKLF
jgi:hypothetical protein